MSPAQPCAGSTGPGIYDVLAAMLTTGTKLISAPYGSSHTCPVFADKLGHGAAGQGTGRTAHAGGRTLTDDRRCTHTHLWRCIQLPDAYPSTHTHTNTGTHTHTLRSHYSVYQGTRNKRKQTGSGGRQTQKASGFGGRKSHQRLAVPPHPGVIHSALPLPLCSLQRKKKNEKSAEIKRNFVRQSKKLIQSAQNYSSCSSLGRTKVFC